MGFQTISDARFVRVDGRRLLVSCYDPDTGDVVALWPSDLAEAPDTTGHPLPPAGVHLPSSPSHDQVS
jgi:hypothetical protein